jgi:biotin synthase-related radical SAM superfamily protein
MAKLEVDNLGVALEMDRGSILCKINKISMMVHAFEMKHYRLDSCINLLFIFVMFYLIAVT